MQHFAEIWQGRLPLPEVAHTLLRRVAFSNRITSYNVCYTKLLRWKVFATARNPLDIIDFSQMGATTLALDVTSDDSVNAAAEYVTKKHGSLDVLVNNAGFGIYGPLEELPIEKAKKQFETNVFGLARVTNAFLPLLRLGNRPLIVNISSVAGLAAMPLGGWYCASKYAVEALSDTYRTELHKFGIKTVLVEPGPVVSNFSKVVV